MEKPHYVQHRERLRERFMATGFEGFKEYEALELLLTWAIPRRDVKPKTLRKPQGRGGRLGRGARRGKGR